MLASAALERDAGCVTESGLSKPALAETGLAEWFVHRKYCRCTEHEQVGGRQIDQEVEFGAGAQAAALLKISSDIASMACGRKSDCTAVVINPTVSKSFVATQ